MALQQVTIKALATSKDGLKQSSVVTKTFVVHETEEVCSDDEGASSREKDNVSGADCYLAMVTILRL